MGPRGRGGQEDEAVELTGERSFVGASTVSIEDSRRVLVFSTSNGTVVLVPLEAIIQSGN
jgi:hypothetical protein